MTPDEREFRDKMAHAAWGYFVGLYTSYNDGGEFGENTTGVPGREWLANLSFDYAHAMLEERRKREGEEEKLEYPPRACQLCGTMQLGVGPWHAKDCMHYEEKRT